MGTGGSADWAWGRWARAESRKRFVSGSSVRKRSPMPGMPWPCCPVTKWTMAEA
jgi:hypothetical protein